MPFQQSRVTFSNPFLHRAVDVFDSLYESFNPLNVIATQHFVEWFSGDALDSIWTQGDAGGVGTFQMEDSIDGGFSIQSGATAADFSFIGFNNIKHYDADNSILIAVFKDYNIAVGNERVGLNNLDSEEGLGTHSSYMEAIQSVANYRLSTINVSFTQVAGSVLRDTNFHSLKIQNTASDCKMIIDGVLDVTNTTTLPTDPLQPRIGSRADNGAGKVGIRYLEVFNT